MHPKMWHTCHLSLEGQWYRLWSGYGARVSCYCGTRDTPIFDRLVISYEEQS